MISPEILRRYPFFGDLNSAQLVEIADITEVAEYPKGTILFKEHQTAIKLYLLIGGNVELFFTTEEAGSQKFHKELPFGDINPGEPFGLSAVLDPYILKASARVAQDSKTLEMDAIALRALFEKNPEIECKLMSQVAKALMSRLTATRIQLAAAWA